MIKNKADAIAAFLLGLHKQLFVDGVYCSCIENDWLAGVRTRLFYFEEYGENAVLTLDQRTSNIT
jgi:hypothetical protein